MKCPTNAVVSVDVKGLNEELAERLGDGYFDDSDPFTVEDNVQEWLDSNIGRFMDVVFTDA